MNTVDSSYMRIEWAPAVAMYAVNSSTGDAGGLGGFGGEVGQVGRVIGSALAL